MANTLKIYADAALTNEQVTPVVATQNVDGTSSPVDFQLWLGSATAGRTFQASSNPGTDQIVLSVLNNTLVWAAAVAKVVDNLVRTTAKNGYRYKVQSITGGGLTGASEPTWPTTIGNTVIDNEVTWVNEGKQHENTEVKLALTQGALGVGIQTLDMGLAITSAAPVEFWMQVNDVTQELATLTELHVDTNLTDET